MLVCEVSWYHVEALRDCVGFEMPLLRLKVVLILDLTDFCLVLASSSHFSARKIYSEDFIASEKGT